MDDEGGGKGGAVEDEVGAAGEVEGRGGEGVGGADGTAALSLSVREKTAKRVVFSPLSLMSWSRTRRP